jgi:hypothetical protein
MIEPSSPGVGVGVGAEVGADVASLVGSGESPWPVAVAVRGGTTVIVVSDPLLQAAATRRSASARTETTYRTDPNVSQRPFCANAGLPDR